MILKLFVGRSIRKLKKELDFTTQSIKKLNINAISLLPQVRDKIKFVKMFLKILHIHLVYEKYFQSSVSNKWTPQKQYLSFYLSIPRPLHGALAKHVCQAGLPGISLPLRILPGLALLETLDCGVQEGLEDGARCLGEKRPGGAQPRPPPPCSSGQQWQYKTMAISPYTLEMFRSSYF